MNEDELFFYRAAVGFHDLSSFGGFPHPESADEVPAPSTRETVAPRVTVRGLGAELDATGLVEALRGRRSVRRFESRAVPLRMLAACLWAGFGRGPAEEGRPRAHAPSAGALWPLRALVVARSVEGLDPGCYEAHAGLDEVELCDRVAYRAPEALRTLFVTQHVDYESAAAVVFVVAALARTAGVYGERAYRFVLLEAGHVMQNFCLAATGLGLGHVCLGGYDDARVDEALGLRRPAELCIYAVALGRSIVEGNER